VHIIQTETTKTWLWTENRMQACTQ